MKRRQGMSFGAYLGKNFFEPLGMKDTGFFVPEEKRDRLVTVYQADGNGGLVPYLENHLGIINAMDGNRPLSPAGPVWFPPWTIMPALPRCC